jgi:DNA-binding CsgD family transcriptional regulator
VTTDLIGVVEAAYRIEQSEDGWLRGLLGAVRTMIDYGFGIVSYVYDASNPAALRLNASASEGLSDENAAYITKTIPLEDPDFVRRSFLSLSCGTSRDVPGWHEQSGVDRAAKDFGIRDWLAINGRNPNGQGCLIMALLGKEMRLTAQRREVLTKISCHLAAAHRLRQSLANKEARAGVAEAILDHDGKVHHAEGEASSKVALSCLKRSALAMARSRGSLRAREPEQAVDEWKGLIAARWTLVDVRETDGRRYLVARQNRPRTQEPSGLTEREQEVVALAAMGHHNKLIAYNLGISHSTVRVLMARAAGKLGARSRDELLRRRMEILTADSK